MWKLACILYLLVAPVLAGVAVLVGLSAPELGLATMDGVAMLGGAGLALGAPAAFIVAAMMPRGQRIA